MSEPLDLTAIEGRAKRAFIDYTDSFASMAYLRDDPPSPVEVGPIDDMRNLIARVRELEAENETLQDRPCAHRWTGTEEGIRCAYCGVVE